MVPMRNAHEVDLLTNRGEEREAERGETRTNIRATSSGIFLPSRNASSYTPLRLTPAPLHLRQRSGTSSRMPPAAPSPGRPSHDDLHCRAPQTRLHILLHTALPSPPAHLLRAASPSSNPRRRRSMHHGQRSMCAEIQTPRHARACRRCLRFPADQSCRTYV